MKIICYELNELPWAVLDLYVTQRPNSTFSKILQQGRQFTTVTRDSGELHPWTTWPTFHRGVYNDQHEIRFINQEILTDYPPIWEFLAKAGYTVGVFGSLQSWPIPQDCKFSFYVPDTFAQDAQTWPQDLQAFQAFNLEQTGRDGAVAGVVDIRKYLKTLIYLLKTGLSLNTLLKLGRHLSCEKFNQDYKTFRSVMQAPVAFDFYWKLLNERRPDFSTFFSNHVAGMMHRYWKYLFPEEFCYQLESKRDFFLAKNILRAMDIADEQLKKLKQFADKNGYVLLIASSMGQEAIDRGVYHGEFRIKDPQKFIRKLGFFGIVRNTLAMQPDFAFVCNSEEVLRQFVQAVEKLQNEKGEPLFTFKISGLAVNINLKGYSVAMLKTKELCFDKVAAPVIEYGIDVIFRDQGTGYHQPEGVALFYGTGITASAEREKIELIQIMPGLLKAYGLALPSYLSGPLSDVL